MTIGDRDARSMLGESAIASLANGIIMPCGWIE